MILNFYKNILVGSVIMSMLLSPSILLRQANAQFDAAAIVPALEQINTEMLIGFDVTIAALETQTTTYVTGKVAEKAEDTTEKLTAKILKFLGMQLKKLILDRMVDQASQWIARGGFEGTGGDLPFVEDIGSFLQQAGEDAIGAAALEIIPQLCSPFQLNVSVNLFSPPATLADQSACSLSDVTKNIDTFFQNFKQESKGRWLAYNAVWEPQNNYYGSTLTARDLLETTKQGKIIPENIKLNIGSGFFPQQRCTYQKVQQTDGTYKDVATGCKTVTPGKYISDSILKVNYTKSDAIITGDDLSTYLGTLLDAVLYRYSLLAMGGLKAALYKDDSGAGKDYATYSQELFSQVDKITFKNNQAVLLEDINAVLTVKRATINLLNTSINTQVALRDTLKMLKNCQLTSATIDQTDRMAELDSYLENVETSISNLELKRDQITDEKKQLEEAQKEFKELTSDEDATMLTTYDNLKNSGALDKTKTDAALADAQAELPSIQEERTNLLETDSSQGGYKDIISTCSALNTAPTQ